MYVNPMGMPIRETTTDSVALNASVRGPMLALLGSGLLVDSSSSRTEDEPTRKSAKVPMEQMRKFRRLRDLPLSFDNTDRAGRSHGCRFLGKLVLSSATASL